MNYHFFCWDDKFVDGFIELADQVSRNNVFVYYFSKPAKYVKSDKGIFAPQNSIELVNVLSNINEADKVFFHPLTTPDLLSKIPTKTKVYAIFWGGEFLNINHESGVDNVFGNLLYEPITKRYMKSISHVYRRHYLIQYIKNNLKKKNFEGILKILLSPFEYHKFFNSNLINYVHTRKQFLKRVNAICHWNNLDVGLLEDLFEEKIKHKNFLYGATKELLSSDLEILPKKKVSETLVFFVGNSDTPTNNHLDTFSILKRFRYENIKIYTPLSYQNGEYAKYIAKIGHKLFEDKFVPIFDFMAKEKYYELMDTMDICIMNHRRTQAGGNVISFLAKGKKVFLNPNSTLYLFLKNMGVEVFSAKSLQSLTLDELRSEQNRVSIRKNIEIIKSYFDYEAVVKSYTDLLN